MNAYGDSRSHGRVRVPGPTHDEYGDNGYAGDYSHDSYAASVDPYRADSGTDPYPADPYAQPEPRASARTSVGSASVGRAAAGRASVGRATVGAAASVAGADEAEALSSRYEWSGAGASAGARRPPGRPAGRASVPASPGAGRAQVRAGAPGGPGGPGGPGAPGGPGGKGPGGGRPKKSRKKILIRNTLLASIALIVMGTGGGMVALSYYVDSVPLPAEIDLPQGTTFHYSNGKQLGKLAEQNRVIIDTKVPELETVRNAVVAAEDGKYYEHSGVDFAGIARAAWNNVTGGDTQGASTISQQYARAAADTYEISYARKLREAAMAYKLDRNYSKEDILDFYLNTVYFGRGAYGIEAAAKAYFRKSASELDVAQAAVLAATIKEPDDGSGFSPYDPTNNPEAAEDRWNYVLDQMVEHGWVDAAERAGLELPEVKENPGCLDDCGVKTAQGNVINYAIAELQEMGITDIRTGGYRVTTSIDHDLQKIAVKAARRKSGGSLLADEPKNLMAALVSVDPQNGRVVAYYGGDDGTGFDYAGKNWDESVGAWVGGRPPGSSFKEYDLIAAQEAGISFQSRWDSTNVRDPGGFEVENAGRSPACAKYCTLEESTVLSLNVPFYHISVALGPDRIVDAARAAGVTMMWDTQDGASYDLTTIESGAEVAPSVFYHPVAYGQYPITVLDHANGTATLAARGMYHKAHFVVKVEQKNKKTGEWEEIAGDKIEGEQRVRQEIADSITQVLAKVPGSDFPLNAGRPAAAKTGTWELEGTAHNADAWTVGYTPQLATAVWVGNKGELKPILNKWGGDIFGAGLPGQIFKRFMDEAHAAKDWPIEQFPQAAYIGNDQHPAANGASPTPRRGRGNNGNGNNCLLPILCDDNGGDQGAGGGGVTIEPTPLPRPEPTVTLLPGG